MSCWQSFSLAVVVFFWGLASGTGRVSANELDQILDAENQGVAVTRPALPVVDDLSFLRRATVDLVGRIPTHAEIEEFLAWPEAERRDRLVDKLMEDPRFADRWTIFFADLLRLRSNTLGGSTLIAYVHQALRQDMAYDELCRRLITATGKPNAVPEVAFILGDDADPLAMAAVTSQVFLGVRMGCAECHDHPFDVWTQEDFYGLAAFFGKTRRIERTLFQNTRFVYTTDVNDTAVLWPPEGIGDPQDRKPMAARFPFELKTPGPDSAGYLARLERRRAAERRKQQELDQEQSAVAEIDQLLEQPGTRRSDGSAINVALEAEEQRRQIDLDADRYHQSELRGELARKVTDPRNRYFSRSLVNRLWAELLGRGFVEPVDDFRQDNPPSHPETLDYLADEFVASGFQFRPLVRMIVTSDTYQRAHATEGSEKDRQQLEAAFLAAPLRRMLSEVLYDSIITAGHLARYKHPEGANLKTRLVAQRVRVDEDGDEQPADSEALASLVEMSDGQAAVMEAMQAMPSDMAASAEGYNLENTIELDFDALLMADRDAPELEKMQVVSAEELAMQQERMENRNNSPQGNYETRMVEQTYDDNPIFTSALRMATPAPEGHFLRIFGQPSRVTLGELRDPNPSMRQALMILNGRLTHEASRVGPMEPIYGLLVGKQADLAEAVRYAYREILTREPEADELAEATAIVRQADDPLGGMADLRWALLNCNEFRFVP